MPIQQMGSTKSVIERHERTQPTSVHGVSKDVMHRATRHLNTRHLITQHLNTDT